jgi:hypothetical protein
MEQRLDLLTHITLEVDDEQIINFCEGYRWLLGAKDRKEQVANNERIQAIIDRAHEDASDEVDGEESEEQE